MLFFQSKGEVPEESRVASCDRLPGFLRQHLQVNAQNMRVGPVENSDTMTRFALNPQVPIECSHHNILRQKHGHDLGLQNAWSVQSG